MRQLLSIARKDLLQIARDRKSFIFLVLMPLLFTVFFGLAFGGFTRGGDGDERLLVGVLGGDGGPLEAGILQLLSDSTAIRPEPLDPSEGEVLAGRVADGDLTAILRFPAGGAEGLALEEPEPLVVLARTDTLDGQTAVEAIEVALTRFRGALRIADFGVAEREEIVPFESDEARRAFRDEAVAAALTAWQVPPLTVAVRQQVAAESAEPNPYSQASPGMMVQFALYGLIVSAMVLVLERKSGALARLLTTPAAKVQIISGHLLAMFVVVLLQIALLVAFGQLALGVDYLSRPLALALVAVPLSLWSASLGLLIGAFSKTEDHVIIGSLVAMFVFSALGGAWFPLEITGRTFSAIGHLLPTAWAMDAFQDIVVRGLGAGAVLLPSGLLLLYALLFLALAVWRFRFR